MIKHITTLLMSICFIHCKQEPKPIPTKEKDVVKEETKDEVQEVAPANNVEEKEPTPKAIPSDWEEIDKTSGIAIDIKYATR